MCIYQLITMVIAATTPRVHFEPLHTSLSFDEPTQVIHDGVLDDIVYVVEKDGIIRSASTNRDASTKPIFLDITDRVGGTHDEEGLLSACFHPNYSENGEIYVWYTAQNPKRGVLSKFIKDQENDAVDQSSEQVVLEVREPWGNHNGGTVLFGPDGFLYLGIGDGGAANDPHNNGQDKNTLLGSIIRIDVSQTGETKESTYSIPKDNPLVGKDGAREELWAWGLRNPWRMSFDKETGKLWTGDVGQNAWEEIDVVERGGNYGWNYKEGTHKFKDHKDEAAIFIDPVYEYNRRLGGSITGGYVYRGSDIPSLVGSYLYSDYLSKRVWALVPQEDEDGPFTTERLAKNTPVAISSFGETPSGEILACGFSNPYAFKGKIYRLVPSAPISSTIR